MASRETQCRTLFRTKKLGAAPISRFGHDFAKLLPIFVDQIYALCGVK
jgi:hypothetical protein